VKLAPVKMTLEMTQLEPTSELACTATSTQRVVDLMLTTPHGVLRMNPDIPKEVDMSVSFSLLELKAPGGDSLDEKSVAPTQSNGHKSADPSGKATKTVHEPLVVHLFARANTDRQMDEIERKLDAIARLSGATACERLNYFPGWAPDIRAPAVVDVATAHQTLFGKPPRVYSVHAGLECGWISARYPKIQCVSIGPKIENAHTPDEALDIASVKPFFDWLRASIETIAKRTAKG